MRHAVIGVGEVGGAILANLRDHFGSAAVGFDLGEEKDFSAWAAFPQPYYMHVCYPYSNKFLPSLEAWVRLGEPHRCSGIVIHSSTRPGTVNKWNRMVSASNSGLPIATHSPVNGKHVTSRTMETYIRTLPKFFSGPNEKAITRELREVWDICWLNDNPNTSEMMKLLATSYYGMLICWTQYIHKMCKDKNLEYEKVMSVFREIDSEERRVGKECRSRWSPYH